MIQGSIETVSPFGRVEENLSLQKEQFSPFRLYNRGAMDSLLRGLASQTSQSFDNHFADEVRQHLFQQPGAAFGMDLVALNIQRGRDHGLPPYNDWREICQLGRANSFEDLNRHFTPNSVQVFRNMYQSVNDIDLFLGGVAE